MADHRRVSDSPYEDDYLGIRPPQPKLRSHRDGRSRHRSRSAGRRGGDGGGGGGGKDFRGIEGSEAGEWDRHQQQMRRERKRLREKMEQSRRAEELVREEHMRQSSALRGSQRPQSMAQMAPHSGGGVLSSLAVAKRSSRGGGDFGGHRHRHRKGSPSRSGSSGGGGVAMGGGGGGSGEAERRKHGKRRHRDSEGGPGGSQEGSSGRGRSRSPLRSQIASAAVQPKGRSQQKDRDAPRGSRGRRRRDDKDRGGRRRSFSSSSSSSSSSSRSSSASPESYGGRRRRASGERHHRRKRKSREDDLEDIALLTEPDVGIGEELDDEVEEGEAGSDVGSLSPEEHARAVDREEGEHEEEEEEVEAPGRAYVPGKSKFDSPSSSSSSSSSGSHSGTPERRRASSDDDDEEEEEGEEAEEEDEEENSSEEERRNRPLSKEAAHHSDDSSDDQEMAGASSEEEEEEEEDRGDGPATREEEERRAAMERERRRLDKPWYLPSVLGCRSVEEFSCLNRIEEGTYGVVYRARDKKTSEVVALKRLKMEKEREGFPITSLREINTLLKAQHPNIVTVREIVVGSNMDKIYIVMGYVEHDLKSLMEVMKEPFMIGEVKTLMVQLLSAVAHLHDNWILHRDLKTSNLLLSHKGVLKVGDFGLAREYGSPLRRYTPVVVTLWYRAVELLLGAKLYSTAVDMWSVGCIFAELLLMKALFPGKGEANQLNLIFRELGTPNERIWPGFGALPLAKKMVTEPIYQFNSLRKRFPDNVLSDLGFDLMNKLLTYSPERRISADDALKHSYLSEKPHPIPPHHFPTWPAKSEGAVVHHKKRASPKPPSGGLAYSKIVASSEKELPEGLGFRLAGDANAAQDKGFRLKF